MLKVLLGVLMFFSTTIAFATDFSTEQAEVEAFLANHTVTRVTNYCRTDVLNCRSLVEYKNNTTNQLVDSFEDRFMSSTNGRAVSFRGFFLKQSNGTFNIYAQNVLSNEVKIDTVEPFNQGVTINFNSSHLPTLPLKFILVGTNPLQIVDDTLIYTDTEATFTKNTISTADDFVIPLHSQTNH